MSDARQASEPSSGTITDFVLSGQFGQDDNDWPGALK